MRTKHFQQRMSQRGIRNEIVDVTLEFGTPMHDGKRRLDRKVIRRQLEELDKQRKALLEAERRGGVVVVEEEGALITTYGIDK